MTLTSTTPNGMRMRDLPVAYLLGSIGLFAFSLPIGLLLVIKLPFPPPAGAYEVIILVAFAFCYGIWLLVAAKIRTTLIDKHLKTVAFSTLGVFGSRYRLYRFDELANGFGPLRVNRDYRRRFGNSLLEFKVYGVQLALASGDTIDLTSYAWFYLKGYTETVEQVNKLILG